MAKTAAIVNYQNRAVQFAVGDVVYPFLAGESNLNGRVTAVWPAIGMVDVEWPHGSERLPVEDIQKLAPDAFYQPPEVAHGKDSIPGGAETLPVSIGPADQTVIPDEKKVKRVANAFFKKALYWASKDRQYKISQMERDNGCYYCPKCGEVELRKAIYKRRDGESVHLLGCPQCLFLIKNEDIIGDPHHIALMASSRRQRRL